jgi:hypothetical protein
MARNPVGEPRRGRGLARLETETKHALKTTEFWTMVAAVAGILVASAFIGKDPQHGRHHDAFRASQAFLYVAIVAVGYMISRGIAKAGSREPYWTDSADLPVREDRT